MSGIARKHFLFRSPWRVPFAALCLVVFCSLIYILWQPGAKFTDGRHDRSRNGIWLSHAWLGDDNWFSGRARKPGADFYRNDDAVAALTDKLREHGITDVFPHLCPAQMNGELPGVDHQQVERFLNQSRGLRIMPWIGGVLGRSARIDDPAWRKQFCESAGRLLRVHPRLAGIHLNVEPCPSGDTAFISLLRELRVQLPSGAILSVAAYPPPTIWQRSKEVHWDERFFREVARQSDQMVVMMYDTSIRWRKPYIELMSRWTREVLVWSEGREVLLGLPVYDDKGVEWHHPEVENLITALAGVHAGLNAGMPVNYAGVAIYSEWEMSSEEWLNMTHHFLRSKN